MENKVIAKEYVDKNYIHKDVLIQDYEWLKQTGKPKDLETYCIRLGAMEYIRQSLERLGVKVKDK